MISTTTTKLVHPIIDLAIYFGGFILTFPTHDTIIDFFHPTINHICDIDRANTCALILEHPQKKS